MKKKKDNTKKIVGFSALLIGSILLIKYVVAPNAKKLFPPPDTTPAALLPVTTPGTDYTYTPPVLPETTETTPPTTYGLTLGTATKGRPVTSKESFIAYGTASLDDEIFEVPDNTYMGVIMSVSGAMVKMYLMDHYYYALSMTKVKYTTER